MRTKQEILAELQESINAGVITSADLNAFAPQPAAAVAIPQSAEPPEAMPKKLTAIDAMFYVAGMVLFGAMMSLIVQSWGDGSALMHILLSAGVGLGLWALAFYLVRGSIQNDFRKGLSNALLLTGSLMVVVGGYITSNELIGGYDEINYIPGAINFAVLGLLHIWFDNLVRRDLVLMLGILLSVASFPALMFGFLQDASVSADVWAAIFIVAALMLAFATRLVAKVKPDRPSIREGYDGLAAFLSLATMYFSSFGDNGTLWLVLLIGGVLVIFYRSIVTQSKQLLGNGSFFLVLTVITIAFRYFSGYGVTLSLIFATIGVLASAAVATSINKRYFKKPAEPTQQ